MDLPARERNHHHADPARRRIAACRPRLRSAIGALSAGDLAVAAYPRAPDQGASARGARHAGRSAVRVPVRRRAIDRSVALAGLLTAQVRGSLPTAPVILVRADTPGTGKSYLVDLFAMISTGRLCPVITASKNAEETEKRLGAVLLGGTPSSRSTTSCTTSAANCCAS